MARQAMRKKELTRKARSPPSRRNQTHGPSESSWRGESTALRAAVGLQRPHDGADGTPTSRGHQRSEDRVELAKVADRPHVAAIFAHHHSIGDGRHAHEPIPAFWNRKWQRGARATGAGEKAG